MKNRTILKTKNIFTITLMVIFLTILSVWILGLGKHRTLIENSILSTAILSSAFFLFIMIGLYRGVKLKDNLGKITDQFDLKKIENLKDFTIIDDDTPDLSDGIAGIIIGIILWIVISILFSLLLWAFGAILWMGILIFMAMLYWIFFRALRLVFKKSPDCQGQLDRSLLYAFFYTILYNFWIFGIIYFAGKN